MYGYFRDTTLAASEQVVQRKISMHPPVLPPQDSKPLQDVAIIVFPEADDLVTDGRGDQEIDEQREPTDERPQQARRLLLIIVMQSAQRIVQLSADFAGVVEIGKQLGKGGTARDHFAGSFSGLNGRFPGQHGTAQRRRTARLSRQLPAIDDRHPRRDQGFERDRQSGQRHSVFGATEGGNRADEPLNKGTPRFTAPSL